MQRRAGVSEVARCGGRIIAAGLPEGLEALLARQRRAAAASMIGGGRGHAKPLDRREGFLEHVDHELLSVARQRWIPGWLARDLAGQLEIGLFVFDPSRRGGLRVNDCGRTPPTGLLVTVAVVNGFRRKYK